MFCSDDLNPQKERKKKNEVTNDYHEGAKRSYRNNSAATKTKRDQGTEIERFRQAGRQTENQIDIRAY